MIALLAPRRASSPPAPAPRADLPAGARAAAALVAQLRAAVLRDDPGCERCHVLFLDAALRPLGTSGVGHGARHVLLLRMRPVFAEALRLGARAMILAHNHPSGRCHPSAQDISATRRLAAVGRALDIELVDHLIFTEHEAFSMRAGRLL